MENLYVQYNSQMCLKSNHSMKCVGIQTATQILRANYPPSFVQLKQKNKLEKLQRPHYTLKIKVVSRDQQKDQFLIEGSKVHLINIFTDEYITCSSAGQIKFDKKSVISEEVNKHLYKASTWTVQFLKNQTKVIQTQKQKVTVYDNICFKSVHSTYLTIKPNTFQLLASSEVDSQKSVWNLIKANVPHIPEWVFSRDLFCKFSQVNLKSAKKGPEKQFIREKKLLKSFTPQVQQLLLIEDLLDLMLGYEGVYIKRHPTSRQFVIQPYLQQPSCTLAHKQLVQKILILPTLYYKIQAYITTQSYHEGVVCQALCGGLRTVIGQYLKIVTGFDKKNDRGQLSLQRLWLQSQASIKIIESLANLVVQAQNYKGGQLLTLLSKLLNQNTDNQINDIYQYLFTQILQVYIQMMSKWLYEGIIEDKYDEFMIMTQQKSQNKEWNYWEQKFMIRQKMVPSIFAKEATQILVTGKYLNILKACNKLVDHPYNKEIFFTFKNYISLQSFSTPILRAYQWANQEMLELVFNQCKFTEVLKSIKGYFFLQFGDLFVHFMDTAEQDLSMLKKKTLSQGKGKIFSEQKMQNLFELLLRTSSANNDPFKQEVTCRVQNTTIYDQMHRIKTLEPEKLNFDFTQKPFVKRDSKYVDFMTVQYKCQFPLTLIFNKKNMSKYQVLFRFIFWCKFIQRQLNSVWLSLQQTKQIPLKFYTPAYLLNQRMINFIKNFIYYLCYEVIEQNWIIFTESLKKVKTFQDIIECHNIFLNKCLKQSLLSNSRLLTIITSQIGKACQNFTVIRTFINKLVEQFNFQAISSNAKSASIVTQRKIYIEQMKQHIEETLQQKDFRSIVDGYGTAFDDSMRKFLRQIYEMIGKQENYLLNLVNRLDQERFYNKRLFGGNTQSSFKLQ